MRNTGDSILYIRQHFVSTYKYKGPAFETTHNCEAFYVLNCEFICLFIEFFSDEHFIDALLTFKGIKNETTE